MDGEVDQGPWLQERVGGGVGAMAVAQKGEGWGLVGCSKEEQVQGRGQGRVGLAVGGGARASVASFLTRTKRRKMAFFEGGGSGRRGKGWGGGARASVAGGVSGRGTGPRDGANFAILSFLTFTKGRKMAFFEGCPVGCGGGTLLAWWTGG